MIELIANIAEILAGLAIIGAAFRAWPVFTNLDSIVEKKRIDKRAVSDDIAKFATGLSKLGIQVTTDSSVEKTVKDWLEGLHNCLGDWQFDLYANSELPGAIYLHKFGKERERVQVCTLSRDGYIAIFKELKAQFSVDESQTSGTGRLSHAGQLYMLDYAQGSIGPIGSILWMPSKVLTAEDLGLIDGGLLREVDRIADGMVGMVMFCGWEGSGRTTTAVAVLDYIVKSRNVRAVEISEDFATPKSNVSQLSTQGPPSRSLDEVWRDALRLRPSVIFLHDATPHSIPWLWKTYGMNHLCLTQVHAREAVACLVELNRHSTDKLRLIEWPILIVGQMLESSLCDDCKTPHKLSESEREFCQGIIDESEISGQQLKLSDKFSEALGCDKCEDGFRGRLAIHEVLDVTQSLQNAAGRNQSYRELRRAAVHAGMRTFQIQALELASLGKIAFSAVKRLSEKLEYEIRF